MNKHLKHCCYDFVEQLKEIHITYKTLKSPLPLMSQQFRPGVCTRCAHPSTSPCHKTSRTLMIVIITLFFVYIKLKFNYASLVDD